MLLRELTTIRGARKRASLTLTANREQTPAKPSSVWARLRRKRPQVQARSAAATPWKIERLLEGLVAVCLLLGAVAIRKAGTMERADEAVLCLAGAIGACTLVCYLYFQRD